MTAAPHIQCARCHGTLSEHTVSICGTHLLHIGLDCELSIEHVREQLLAWAEYALGNGDAARQRNYIQRRSYKGGPP